MYFYSNQVEQQINCIFCWCKLILLLMVKIQQFSFSVELFHKQNGIKGILENQEMSGVCFIRYWSFSKLTWQEADVLACAFQKGITIPGIFVHFRQTKLSLFLSA